MDRNPMDTPDGHRTPGESPVEGEPRFDLPGADSDATSMGAGGAIDSGGAIDDGGGPDSGRPYQPGHSDGPGNSESSPGHLKKDAGDSSARDYAPGGHAKAQPGIEDVAPDEVGDGS